MEGNNNNDNKPNPQVIFKPIPTSGIKIEKKDPPRFFQPVTTKEETKDIFTVKTEKTSSNVLFKTTHPTEPQKVSHSNEAKASLGNKALFEVDKTSSSNPNPVTTNINNIIKEDNEALEVKKEEEKKIDPNEILNEKVKKYIEDNRKKEIKERPTITQIKSSYEKFKSETKTPNSIEGLTELNEEIKKIESWMEKYIDYIQKKKKKQYEQLDLAFLEVLIVESTQFISNLSSETSIISSDLKATENFTNVLSSYITSTSKSNDIFSIESLNIFLTDASNEKKLSMIISDLASNKIISSNKFFIETAKCLEWCLKVRKVFTMLKQESKIEYHQIYKIYIEGTNLKRFNEIKKQDYIAEFVNQINVARSYKEISDLLSKNKNKQIANEDFDKIVNNYETMINCKISFRDEKEIIDALKKTRNDFIHSFEQFTKSKVSIGEYEKMLNEMDKFPIKMNELKQKIQGIIDNTFVLQKEVKKLNEQKTKKKLIITIDKVTPLINKLKDNEASFIDGDNLIKNYDTSKECLNKLNKMITDPKSDLYEMIALKESITIHSTQDEKEINKVIWSKKFDELIQNQRPSYMMIEHLLSEAKDIGVDDDSKLKSLRDLSAKGNELILQIANCEDLEALDKFSDEKIDISEYIIQRRIQINMNIHSSKAIVNETTAYIGNKRKKSEDVEDRKVSSTVKTRKNNNLLDDIGVDVNNVNVRSKRRIKRKMEKDYYYEKDFVDQFENKIAQRSDEEDANQPPAQNEKIIDDEPHSEEEKEIESIDEDALLQPKKKKVTKQKKEDPMKTCIKKNAITQLENVLKSNEHFSKEGNEYIEKLAVQLEEELTKNYPKIDGEYQKTLANILKTMKELEKYKKICHLVKKGKLTLFKMLKFPYGNKFIQKLKNIEYGNIKNNNNTDKSSQPSQSNKQITKAKDNNNDIDNSNKDTVLLKSVLSSVQELYSSLSTDKDKIKTSTSNEVSTTEDKKDQMDIDDDNDSLKSLDADDNIRFSPSNTANVVAPRSGAKDVQSEKNEKLYDPFSRSTSVSSHHSVIFPIFYDPDTVRKSDYTNDNTSSILRGSLISIFKGPLTINKSQISQCTFYSMNSIDMFRLFPTLGSDIVITNRAKTSEVVPYCEKQLNNKNKIELFGWIEVENDLIDKFNTLIDECDRHDKCGCLISKGVKMYIFTLTKKYSNFYHIVKKESDIVNKSNKYPHGKLFVFVMIGNKSEIENNVSIIKKMEPIVIKKKEISIETIKEEPNEDNVSSITDNENNSNNLETNDEKLERLINTNDMKLLEDYVNTNFSNLSQEQIVEKLMTFNEESRAKLLDLIMQYQNNSGHEDVEMTNAEQPQQTSIADVINEEQQRRINQIQQQPQPNQNNLYMMNPMMPMNMYQMNPMYAEYYRQMQANNANINNNK